MTPTDSNAQQVPLPGAERLDDASRQLIAQARVRRKRIDRVMAVANFNGWTAAIFAMLSVPFVVFDASTAVAVVVLAVVAFVEFRGRTMVRQFNERGLIVLASNQLVLGLLIIVYAVWQLLTLSGGNSAELQQLQSLGTQGKQWAEMIRSTSALVYWLLIAGTILFQGGMARFYLRSRKAMRSFIADTPAWVIDVLTAAG